MITSRRISWLLPAVLGTVALLLFLLGLESPSRIIFDETYYVNDALDYLRQGVEEGFSVHPPVGKWMIGASITLFGDNAFGWRFMGAASGAAIVLLTYLIGLRLFRRYAYAALAGLLVMTDGLLFVQARTSMLDIYLALFITLGMYLLLVDRDRSGLNDAARAEPGEAVAVGAAPLPSLLQRDILSDDALTADVTDDVVAEIVPPRPVTLRHRGHAYRYLAGLSFGLAIATKWSGGFALAAAVLAAAVFELQWRRNVTGSMWRQLAPAIASITVALVVVPVLVYGASYTPWLVNYGATTEGDDVCSDVDVVCQAPITERLAGLATYHRKMYDFHSGLESDHSYRKPAYTWPLLLRPVVYYYESCSESRAQRVATTNADGEVEIPDPCLVEQGEAAEIIALGNPVLWWLFLPSILLLAIGTGRRNGAAAFIALFYGAQFLPWLAISRPLFVFYMTPMIPLVALGVSWAALSLRTRPPMLWPLFGIGIGSVVGLLSMTAALGIMTEPDNNLRWVGLAVGAVAGAMIAAALDGRTPPTPSLSRRVSILVPVSIAGLATAAFVYFYPVLVGIPMLEAAVRQRWWLQSWI